MTRASLTPLGRQLRVVLANIRPPICLSPEALTPSRFLDQTSHSSVWPLSNGQYRSYHESKYSQSAAAVAVAEFSEIEGTENVQHAYNTGKTMPAKLPTHPRSSCRALKRLPRVYSISIEEALKSTGRGNVAPAKVKARQGSPSVNSRGVHRLKGKVQYQNRWNKYMEGHMRAHFLSAESRLEKIVALYLQCQPAERKTRQETLTSATSVRPEETQSPSAIMAEDVESLRANGYNLDDVQELANIIASPNSLDAAQALARRVRSHGPQSMPLFVLTYLLRRLYISAQALRIIAQTSSTLLDHLTGPAAEHRLPEDSIFTIFLQLVRHAREVWPRALGSLPELLLYYLPRNRQAVEEGRRVSVEILTHMLNKAMRLIAMPSSYEPVKNNKFQEAGMVKILRFMSEHNPPLQTNREGYRAVILLQLAQRKRPKEQLWAELKTLSWPPWKADRTAMDADITFDDHGMSSAAETLKQMQGAGYAHHAWERAASIYTGWDTDRTPTIQSLVLLGTGGERFRNDSTEWVARITATRTAQEAWACYLAYEDKELPPSQDVYLAVFRKLHKEEERHRGRPSGFKAGQKSAFVQRELFPGDMQEVEPLPPSIHLYTYTRTPAPSLDGFYRQLEKRGVSFRGRCLAFLIENAPSLQRGTSYLLESGESSETKQQLTNPQPSDDLSQISMPLFTAFVKLLTRFSNVVSPEEPNMVSGRQQLLQPQLRKFYFQGLNTSHSLVRASSLLLQRRPMFRPAWNAILQSLAKEISMLNIAAVMRTAERDVLRLHLTPEQRKQHGAIMAYRLMRKMLTTMKSLSLDLDAVGYQALCQGAENAIVAVWMILRRERDIDTMDAELHPQPSVKRALDAMYFGPATLAKAEFWTLVGDEIGLKPNTDTEKDESAAAHSEIQLPRLLEVPSLAVFHSCVRCLGWSADYQGLLETLRWMVANQSELAQRVERDRNGELMMSRCIVALRVFLERPWLAVQYAPPQPSGVQSWRSIDQNLFIEHVEPGGWRGQLNSTLRTLETPASEDAIQEAKRLVESVESWGGWPDDDAVAEYCKNSRFRQFQ